MAVEIPENSKVTLATGAQVQWDHLGTTSHWLTVEENGSMRDTPVNTAFARRRQLSTGGHRDRKQLVGLSSRVQCLLSPHTTSLQLVECGPRLIL